jgi:hypothetical protein
MSSVIGFQKNGVVTIGGDSALSEPGTSFVFSLPQEPKVWKQGPYLIGGCGSGRAMQLIRYVAELPEPPAEGDLGRFLVRDVLPVLREVVGAADVRGAEPGSPLGRTSLLLGVRGELWEVGADLVVTPSKIYAAIGAGLVPAFGALYALVKLGVSGRQAVEIALEASAATTQSVRPPFTILSSCSVAGGVLQQ